MMLCARSSRWFYLTFVFLSTTVLAEQQSGNNCDWYCWAEDKLESLQSQIDKINDYLFPNDNSNGPASPSNPPSNAKPNTQGRYSSTFGTSSVFTPPPSASHVVVTVSPTGNSPPIATNLPAEPKPDVDTHDGYRAVAYYGNWDIYARKFFPQQIPATKLTHLFYSFADTKPDGTIILTDSWADTEIHYSGDSWSDTGHNVYGGIKQLALLKAANRNLKVLLSIGGWTYTNEQKHFDSFAGTDAGRKTFAASCVDMVKDYGFDGIDIDWEYPQNSNQGAQFLALLKEVRRALDRYAASLGGAGGKARFLLSIAAPAGEMNYRNIPLGEVADVVDIVNLMAYDYAGSWDKLAGHASNLYPSASNPSSTPFNTQSVVTAYLSAGVPSSKLNLGMPLYGRSFTSTKGLGQPYSGIGTGSWEAGVYDFKAMPLAGAEEYYDAEAGATYSYNNDTGMLISYDTVDMALKKVDYIVKNRLGGAMWWEASGDKTDDGSIISNVVKKLGGGSGSGIESSPNWLQYPDSQYDNIKNLVGGTSGKKLR